jgi:hypothetical protein
MRFGTIGGMKVLALKGIEKISNLWEVRYTRMYAGAVQDAVFLCKTPDEAMAKFRELLDVLQHHNGVYVGSKEKRKVKTGRRNPEEPVIHQSVPPQSSSEHHKEYMKQYYIRKQLGER